MGEKRRQLLDLNSQAYFETAQLEKIKLGGFSIMSFRTSNRLGGNSIN